MPKTPSPTNQLRLFQQGSGDLRALPLPQFSSPAQTETAALPPAVMRTGEAIETIATSARRLAAGRDQTPGELFTAWIDDYCTALRTGNWQLPQAPAAGLTFLAEAAAPGLTAYAGQRQANPDLAGQMFLACLDDAAPWQPCFPPWAAALDLARQFVPNGQEAASARLLEAARTARQDGKAADLNAGQPREQWYAVIEPYLPPLIIGPPLTATPSLTLAVAAQFPAWLIARGKIRFTWPTSGPPILAAIQQLNALLYHLAPYPEWPHAD